MIQVVLMCGPAGSGKSAHARRLAARGFALLSFDALAWELGHQEHPLPDAARDEVHTALRHVLTEHVSRGASVVVDSSFWSRASRDSYRQFLAGLGVEPVVHYVTAPSDVILDRLARRSNSGPDDIAVPEHQALTYMAAFQVPTDAEGPMLRVDGA
ncbi:AAA family ATPase [Agromyces sp. SYSU T00194]|uniref:AAA family ATPase n=1 Tax=Agromyces chitinivorans TaxID=3158560 RepID=UPI0033975DA8